MLQYLQLIFLLISSDYILTHSLLTNSLLTHSLITNNECTNCKHFSKTIYVKSNNILIKPLELSIGYCKLALDIGTAPTIKLYKTVEYFRSDTDTDNCGPDGQFFTPSESSQNQLD